MVDLNSLIPSNSGVQLTLALYINDSGEVAAHGTLSNGDQHAFLLIPCGMVDSSAECSAEERDSIMVPQMNLGARDRASSPTGPSRAHRPQRGLTENKH
jgi:hypothetical protein